MRSAFNIPFGGIGFLYALIALIAAGCATHCQEDVVRIYLKRHPQEAKHFIYLDPVHLDMYEMVWGLKAGELASSMEGIEKRFGNVPTLKELVNKISESDADENRRLLEDFKKLQAASTNGGAICEFQWSDGKTKETGLLVIQKGEIVQREPWITDFLSEKK